MRGKLIALGTTAATIIVGAVITVAPQASAAAGDCPSGATCSWTGTGYTGTMGPVYGDNSNDKQYATWADSESVANNGTQCEDWVFYDENANESGDYIGLQIGYGVSNESGTWMWHHLWSNEWCNA